MVIRSWTGPYSFADFLEMVQEDQKADLLEGSICLASPENLDHNELLLWLTKVLGTFIEVRGLGRLTINKVAYRLSDRNGPEPDLGFVCTDRLHIIRRGYVDGPPDLAVELVSPESIQRDYEQKRRIYEAYGVSEYWILDEMESRAHFFVRDSSGFIEAALEDGTIFRSQALAGLRLDTRWLWQRPLPPTPATVEALLNQAGQ